jgi:hypothetical protein
MSFQVRAADPPVLVPVLVHNPTIMLQLTLFHYMSLISTADPSVLVLVLLHNRAVTSDPPLPGLSGESCFIPPSLSLSCVRQSCSNVTADPLHHMS